MVRWLLALCLMLGCSRAGDEGGAKQWASPPPAMDLPIPASLNIPIIVDGSARPSITGDHLRGTKPDFFDGAHRAWLIRTLVPEARIAGSSVEAVSGSGVSVKFTRPSMDGREPVLFLTRRGDVIVAVLDPRDPFPRYHGQGGRLRRAGDPMPRVSPVARIEITHTRP